MTSAPTRSDELDACTLGSAIQLLQRVEALPDAATGALAFGEEGAIFVESGRICWAVAPNMRARLRELVTREATTPDARTAVDAVLATCKRDSLPLGAALVDSGLVSPAGMRAAFARHTGEAIARLASLRELPVRFREHTRHTYTPPFVFSTVELLASLGAAEQAALVKRAEAHLAEVLVPDASGFAFACGPDASHPRIVAVDRRALLRVGDALQIGGWALGLHAAARRLGEESSLACASWCERTAIVTWRDRELGFAALCSSRPASSRLLSTLAARAQTSARSRTEEAGP